MKSSTPTIRFKGENLKTSDPDILTQKQADYLNVIYGAAVRNLAELISLSKENSFAGAHAKQRVQTLCDLLSAEHAANRATASATQLLFAEPSGKETND